MKNLSENQIKSLPEVWRCAGGDALRRSLYPKKVRIKNKPDFILKLNAAIQACVVFDLNGTVYVVDAGGGVTAFSKDGQFVWGAKLDSGVFSSPARHPEKPILYAGTAGGFVYAINTEDGKILWKKQIFTASDPRILSDILYVQQIDSIVLSGWGGRFYAIDAQDGKEKFSWNAGISPSSAATADSAGNVFALRAVEGVGVEIVKVSTDGKESVLFRQEENKRGARRTLVRACPVVDEFEKVIYFVINLDRGAVLYAFSLETGAVLWKSVLPVCVQASPVVLADGSVAVFDLRGMMICFSGDGLMKYHYQTSADYLLFGGISDISGVVYLGDILGRLHVIDEAGKGRVVFESSRAIQSPMSVSPVGNLYIPSTDHNIYVFKNVG